MNPDFDIIRAYEPADYEAALQRLSQDTHFIHVLDTIAQKLMHGKISAQDILVRLQQCKNVNDIDTTLIIPLLQALAQKTVTSMTISGEENIRKASMILTNHRDIVLDAAHLALLYDLKGHDRIYMGLGTNLFVDTWVETMVKLARCFSVIRGGTPREVLMHSKTLSEYIHYLIEDRQESAWLAQREGRAKDSNDTTQPAVLKMLAMARTHKTEAETLKAIHITPICVSYEYDPCDYLKAREMQIRRDTGEYQKTTADDYLSMYTGLTGYKGQIHYTVTPALDADIDRIFSEVESKQEQYQQLAAAVDKHLHAAYKIYNINRIALDMQEQSQRHATEYSEEEKRAFNAYLDKQISKIDLPNKDEAFLRARIIEMYANPLKNAELDSISM